MLTESLTEKKNWFYTQVKKKKQISISFIKQYLSKTKTKKKKKKNTKILWQIEIFFTKTEEQPNWHTKKFLTYCYHSIIVDFGCQKCIFYCSDSEKRQNNTNIFLPTDHKSLAKTFLFIHLNFISSEGLNIVDNNTFFSSP